VLDGSLPSRRCYSYHARIVVGVIGVVIGLALLVLPVLG